MLKVKQIFVERRNKDSCEAKREAHKIIVANHKHIMVEANSFQINNLEGK